MERLNYHHLFYFWMVAREGGVARASRVLGLTQPTLSGQIKALEDTLGERLFERVGRRLELTEMGRLAYRYAEEIFGLGRELLDALRDRPTGRPLRFTVGVADVVPKMVAYRLIEPALRMTPPPRITVREDRAERLFAALALHELDFVLADAPPGPGVHVRAFSHLLGQCGVTFFAAPRLAAKLRRGFPKSLNGAPVLLPGEDTTLRRQLDTWFERHDLHPHVVGEFDDSALIKAFGQDARGFFAAPTVIEKEVRAQYGVTPIGAADGIEERYYAVSIERRLKHPAVLALTQAARRDLFG
jgi:LysR family transcriptional activator of nhaA